MRAIRLFHLTGVVVASITPVLAHAADKGFADPGSVSEVSPAAGMAQSLLALALVLGVLFTAAWLLKRFRFAGTSSAADMKVLQGISLGAKERAVLVQIKGRRLLLGVAPGQVTLLTELAAEEEAPTSTHDLTSEQQHSFKAILKRSLGLNTP